ncbi:arsenate-mycothiol transferase ArsC [Agrococcus jejuensis]|uniref:Protein-tyrosine phosphatase n=1 Tax=Agrococcus jejuensis TaxID=399736 RepID=A0A1G8B932_9MICO|nr:hypothetical protein [Agrococcus jejuensis]SDH29688.1 protein-tyrosine phosphatase [Agrococcus jejuensis]
MPLPSSPPDEGLVDGPFRVLVVCTGNVCRSPLTAAVLRARLAPCTADFAIASAGLRALEGEPIDPPVAAEAARLGVDVSEHRGRAFAADEAAAADLVIVATRRQRALAVELAPSIVRRTFTLLELDAVLAHIDADDASVDADASAGERLAQVVRVASRDRGPAVRGLSIDLPDPYRGSPTLHRGVADLVDASATRVADRLLELAGGCQPLVSEDVS